MANRIGNIYDNMATAQTAINTIANTVPIHVVVTAVRVTW